MSISERIKHAIAAYPIASSMLGLMIFSIVVLSFHRDNLFNGLDGQYMQLLIAEQFNWMPFGFDFAGNPLQGMGNIFFPFNMNLTLPFALQMRLFGHQNAVISYTIFALELAAAVCLIGRTFALPRPVWLTAAWLLPILALPFIWPPIFNPVYAMIPNCVDLLLAEALLLWAFARLGTGPTRSDYARAGIVGLVPAFAVISNPLVVMTIAPTLVLSFLLILTSSSGRRQWVWRIATLAAALAILLGGGFAHFLIGNTFYTSVAFFADELYRHESGLYFASVFFHKSIFSSAGLILVVMSVAGAVAAIRRLRQPARMFAVFHLVLTAICVVGGYTLLHLGTSWRGPQMVYFETSIWPMYCLYAIYFVYVAVATFVYVVATPLRQFRPPLIERLATLISTPILGAVLTGLGGVGAIVVLAQAAVHNSPPVRPTEETSIVRLVREAIALRPGARFRGSVATFAGGDLAKPITWFDQFSFGARLEGVTGNDHRLTGLWHYEIPTLGEYSQYITPPMYLAFSRLLARATDPQMRNIMALTVPNAPVLRVFGVRFVISDVTLGSGFQLRETLEWESRSKLYLYELTAPNLGNYSPTRVKKVEDATDAIAALKEGIDFAHDVVMTDAAPSNLVPAAASELVVVKGGYRLRLESPGQSLVVLPVQYSRCLDMSLTGEGKDARLLRVNLVQTGVLFSGRIEAELSFRTGPLGSARCRVADIEDMRKIELSAAAKRFPLVPP